MRRSAWFAAFFLLCGAAAQGQSLEQSYAQMCSGEAKGSETCATLRKALMAKLAKLAKDGATAKPLKGDAPTVKAGKVGPGWRMWGTMAGKTLVDENGDIHRFEWVEKGAVLKSVRQTVAGEETTRYELKTDGTLMVLRDGRPPMAMEPNGKASFVILMPGADGAAGERWRYSPGKAGVDIIQEKLEGKKWVATGKTGSRKVATAAAVEAAEAKLAVARDAMITGQWKALGQMVGNDYLYRETSGTGEDHLVSFRWAEFGKSMTMSYVSLPSGNALRSYTIVPTADGKLALSGTEKGIATLSEGKVSIQWPGSKNGRGDLFNDYSADGGTLKVNRYRLKKAKRRDEDTLAYLTTTGIDRQKLNEAASTALAQRKEAARQQQIAEQNSGGGNGFGRMLGGALMGAMLGGGGANSVEMAMIGAQAAANGSNTYEMLTQMGSVAQAKADESKRQLDATIARAQAQAAEDRARKQQEELAAAEARAQAASDAADKRAANAAEATRLREAAAKDAADAKAAAAEAKRKQEQLAEQKRIADEKARRDEERRLAEAEKNRPVEWKEGITLCQKRQNANEWRCVGPLQVTYANLEKPSWKVDVGDACGSSRDLRDIGTYSGYRAFGCGFGIHPSQNMRSYPGNADPPAQLGVFVDNRRIFHCPRTKDAYCSTP